MIAFQVVQTVQTLKSQMMRGHSEYHIDTILLNIRISKTYRGLCPYEIKRLKRIEKNRRAQDKIYGDFLKVSVETWFTTVIIVYTAEI